jgi:hypothetical protein
MSASANNTVKPLAANQTFVGVWEHPLPNTTTIDYDIFSDTPGLLQIEQSADGITSQSTAYFGYTITDLGLVVSTPILFEYFRIKYTNTSDRDEQYIAVFYISHEPLPPPVALPL